MADNTNTMTIKLSVKVTHSTGHSGEASAAFTVPVLTDGLIVVQRTAETAKSLVAKAALNAAEDSLKPK